MDEQLLNKLLNEVKYLRERVERLSLLEQTGIKLLSRVSLTGAAATIDFQSISGIYRHLQLRLYARGDTAATSTGINLTFNADAGNNYDYQLLWGTAAAPTSAETFANAFILMGAMPAGNAPANVFGQAVTDIHSYANAANNKSLQSQIALKRGTAAGTMFVYSLAGFWRSNAAITRITLTPGAGNFASGCLAELFGIP